VKPKGRGKCKSTRAAAAVLAVLTGLTTVILPRPALTQPPGFDAQAVYEKAEAAVQQGRLNEAAEGFRKLAERRPDVPEVHAKLGLVYYLQGRFGEAIPAFQKALELKPGLPNADVLLAISLSEAGRYKEALTGLEKGFENPPDDNVRKLIGLQLQQAYLALGRGPDAARAAAQLSELYPNDPEVLFHAGRLYGDLAYQHMRRLTQNFPDTAWGHQAQAEAYESRGDYDLALVEYRKVLENAPGTPDIHFRMGQTMLARAGDAGRAGDALEQFEKELEINPGHAPAAYQAGEIRRRRGEFEQARKLFQQALRSRPQFEHAHIALGRVLLQLRQPEKARRHLEEAVRLNGDNPVSRYHLSLAYRALGKTEQQREQLEQFRKLRAQGQKEQRDRPGETEVIEQEIEGEPDGNP